MLKRLKFGCGTPPQHEPNKKQESDHTESLVRLFGLGDARSHSVRTHRRGSWTHRHYEPRPLTWRDAFAGKIGIDTGKHESARLLVIDLDAAHDVVPSHIDQATPARVAAARAAIRRTRRWISSSPQRRLQRHMSVDALGGLHVNVTTLCGDLERSLLAFADYLDADTDLLGNQLPSVRWKRAYWARFCPVFMSEAAWMAQGVALGVPA